MPEKMNRLLAHTLLAAFLFFLGFSPSDGLPGSLERETKTELLSQNSAPEESAQSHNIRGMQHYRQKHYSQAIRSFQKAIELDPGHKKANYNLACVYALLPNICGELQADDDIYSEEEFFKQLKRAMEVDPHVKIKARKDPDFHRYRFSIRFLTMLEALPERNDSQGWRKILTGHKQFFTGYCSPGVLGCTYFLFYEDGTFQLHDTGSICTVEPDQCSEKDRKSFRGKFQMKGNRVTLYFENGKTEIWTMPGQGGDPELLENNPDPCSA